jgi:hypothetical protein
MRIYPDSCSEPNIHRPDDDPGAWVGTGLDQAIADTIQERDFIFIVAESGFGKSVACYKWLDRYVAAGGFGPQLDLPSPLERPQVDEQSVKPARILVTVADKNLFHETHSAI